MINHKRYICLDTETTGLDPEMGHKVIELACIEIINNEVTENIFHSYINPERNVPMESFNIHGISEDMLVDKPVFRDIASDFLDFIKDSTLIIHNATFDLRFLNYELRKSGFPDLKNLAIIDTMVLAREKFPGKSASLDALCKRFEIDISAREKHGALIDTKLLASVYIELIGGNQSRLNLSGVITDGGKNNNQQNANIIIKKRDSILPPREFMLSDEDILLHQEFVSKIENNLWHEYSEKLEEKYGQSN